MDRKDLEAYCLQLMVDTYKPVDGKSIDTDALVEELFDYYEQDRASVVDFLKKNKVSDDDIADLVFDEDEDLG
jgi:hypothetical protein